jgi:hypothetical protein
VPKFIEGFGELLVSFVDAIAESIPTIIQALPDMIT